VLSLSFALLVPPARAQGFLETSDEDSESITVYLEYIGGLNFVRNQNLTGADASGAGLAGSADLATGYALGGAVGARFLEHFRAELAISYSDTSVDNFSLQGEPSTAKGGLSLLAIMANGYVDFDFGIGVRPYLGAGIGWGEIEFDARNRSGPGQSEVSDTDSVFAWNVMAGAAVPLSDVVELSLGYRYLATEDPRLKARSAGLIRRLDSEYDAHQLLFGLRLNF
jgi:opacity protein-like surface antigen